MAHKGKRRTVYIGPRGREILAPLLAGGPHVVRVAVPRLRPNGPVDAGHAIEYGRFILAAARVAGVEEWASSQLRHRRATDLHDRFESDADVAAALGNTPEVARQVYVDSPEERVAKRIAERIS